MDDKQPTPIDLAEIRRRLANQQGRPLWRSLNELARTDEFVEFLEHEFPRQAEGIRTAVDRRDFLKLMSASLALAGVTACTQQPEERIVAYVRQPEHLVLGQATYYATAMPLGGYGLGLLGESHEFRPTKMEGNPGHPSGGGTTVAAQASVLGLYDPDRAQVITSAGQIRPWNAFLDAVATVRGAQKPRQGDGLRFLTGTVTSPTLAKQMDDLRAAYPRAVWHQWECDLRDGERLGARLAFGSDVRALYRFDQASVVLSLDADVCGPGIGGERHAKDLARARRVTADHDPCRVYVVDSFPGTIASYADHRLPVRAADVEAVARAIAAAAGLTVRQVPNDPVVKANSRWIQAVAKDLRAHQGGALVVAGEQQPPAVHAIAHALNAALGAVGKTVVYVEPVEAQPTEQLASIKQLAADMDAGKVDCLVVLGVNPVLTAPADLQFAKKMERVGLRIALSPYHDETAELCHWHVPEAHYLESWSDVRAHDGTATIIQPLIAPLYGGRTAHEVVAAFLEETAGRSSYELVQGYWQSRHGGADFATWWEKALHDGVLADTAARPRPATVRDGWDQGQLPTPAGADELELIFRLDPYFYDGRFANNAWLVELPRPFTKLSWDNCALMSPQTAEHLGVDNEDIVQIGNGDRSVRAPVWIVPGMARGSILVHLGWGRWRGGEVLKDVGFDAFALRTSAAPHVARGVTVTKTRERTRLNSTQDHQTMGDPVNQPGVVRPLVRVAPVKEYRAHPAFAQEVDEAPPRDMTLYPNYDYASAGHAWGMSIDVGACIGCMACVAACVAENNITVVGKDQMLRGREMHWLRIDRYYAGPLDNPTFHNQPVPCMQCENAPCEVVCPVNATTHSSEGLNDMVYNRCVGTRYCSNNCPYKVRRFNYYLYQNWTTESLKMARNPDVSVRSRGVMEKCTYCVQRIEEVRHLAKTENRPIRDGEIVTACAQACPTEAIVFGDLNDANSRVQQLKKDPRNYALLAELNTRPRTTYLAAVTNPNPELSQEA